MSFGVCACFCIFWQSTYCSRSKLFFMARSRAVCCRRLGSALAESILNLGWSLCRVGGRMLCNACCTTARCIFWIFWNLRRFSFRVVSWFVLMPRFSRYVRPARNEWSYQNISDEAKDLVTKLLRKEPHKRLPLDEVIRKESQDLSCLSRVPPFITWAVRIVIAKPRAGHSTQFGNNEVTSTTTYIPRKCGTKSNQTKPNRPT